MAKNVKNSGFSVIEIIMAVAIVGLLATVGWLYWQNTTKKSSDSKQTGTVNTSDSLAKKENSSSAEVNSIKDDSNNAIKYFYIDEWKVRFRIPDAIKDTAVDFYTGSGVGYPGKGLVTARIKADKGCGQFANIYLLRRDTNELYEPTGYAFVKEQPINGYWYSTSTNHAYVDAEKNTSCTNPTIVAKDAAALWEMLKSIEASPVN